MTNIECQVTSNSLLPTSRVMSREKDYDQHWVSSHKWQTMTNIDCQVTSDRLTNIGGQVTSDRLWPTLSYEWQLITNIGCQVMS